MALSHRKRNGREMPQTMLAFLALIVVGTHALNTQRYEMLVQQRDITRELEEMAGSIALETMEIIRTRAFDQSVIDGTATGESTDIGVMEIASGENQFATNQHCSVFGGADSCDDIDDFHGMQTATRPFVMGLDTLWFNVDVDVHYVDVSMNHSASATPNKEVTVEVTDFWPNGTSYFAQPVTLSRVFSYEF
ncbi:MAG: hypothetical protein HKN13_05700 [Rhodothermales bacterium]|nr:hypothetical protein [Rhodothermales bacterium]